VFYVVVGRVFGWGWVMGVGMRRHISRGNGQWEAMGRGKRMMKTLLINKNNHAVFRSSSFEARQRFISVTDRVFSLQLL